MKPVIIIVIAVAVIMSILGIVLVNQQTQINELQRNENFDMALQLCAYTFGYPDSSALTDCITMAYEKHGTSEEKQYWSDYLSEEERKEIALKDIIQRLKNDCREKWIGQITEYNKCAETAESLFLFR